MRQAKGLNALLVEEVLTRTIVFMLPELLMVFSIAAIGYLVGYGALFLVWVNQYIKDRAARKRKRLGRMKDK